MDQPYLSSMVLGWDEDGDSLCRLEKWPTQADWDARGQSNKHGVLRWAIKALQADAEIRFHTVSQTREEEAIEEARGHEASE